LSRQIHDRLFDALTRKSAAPGTHVLHDVATAVLLFGPMVACAAALAGVAVVVSFVAPLGWVFWITVSPLLYVIWLAGVLAASASICWLVGARHPKPRHIVVRAGSAGRSHDVLAVALALMSYRRFVMVKSLPLASLLAQLPRFDRLVLRAYAPSVHVGSNVSNKLNVVDPDLTYIGSNVILGGSSTVVAHSLVFRGDDLVYASAPITIGNRVTVGGGAFVGLGARIGDDAIVEQGAIVAPFTRIPAGEVWGGNPARFLRTRDDIGVHGATYPAAAANEGSTAAPARARAGASLSRSAGASDRARELVIEALGVEPHDAEGDLSSETCPLWDSLGQVSIAAAVFTRYGISVDGGEIFRLKTLSDVAALIDPQPGSGSRDATNGDGAGESHDRTESFVEETPIDDDLQMLPLLDAQAATRALAATTNGKPAERVPLRVKVAASFTAHGIEPPLKLWGQAFGFDIVCEFADYDQVAQTLLQPPDDGRSELDAVTVVLVRPEDLPAGAATAAVDQLLDAVERAAAARPPRWRLLVGTLPPVVSSFASVDPDDVAALRHRWRLRLANIAGVEVFDLSQVVERVGIESARSSRLEALTRGGYSQRLDQELAIALVRRIRSAYGRAAKVVAVDCDNTLWGGVVGEVGLEGLELGPDGPGRSFQLFQQYLKRLKDRGLLLAVVSRNEKHDVEDVFAHHPEMVLRADDIAAWQVNWDHKSENLRRLADDLNLGLDSFVFLDDDAATRMEVKTRTPEVHVVPLPIDPADYCETLDRLWLFDGADATTVDATRTQKAREEEHRRRDRDAAGSLDEFLSALDLEVDVRRANDADWPRVAQLTQRTNQFNLSLKRRTLEDVKSLGSETTVLVLAARDRFGDYGPVGVCVLRPAEQPDWFEIDTLLMSCRALGRGVEDAFLHGIAATAASRGATTLVAPYEKGPRNAQVGDFLRRSRFDEVQPNLWILSIENLPSLPNHVRLHVAAETAAAAPTSAPVPAPATARSARSRARGPSSLPVVVFEDEDLSLFSEASKDRNPLHLDASYTRTTAYGEPVVFGILGALAALGHLEHGSVQTLRTVAVEFRQPLFPNVRYRVETRRVPPNGHHLVVWDSGRIAMQVTLTDGPAGVQGLDDPVSPAPDPRLAPVDAALEHLPAGTTVSGAYRPSAAAFDGLWDRWRLGATGLRRDQVAVLLWTSYLVGMELPGKRALFWSLDLRFEPEAPGSQTFSFSATVERADAQLEFVEIGAVVTPERAPWAHAKIRAFVRSEASSLAMRQPRKGRASHARKGTVAVVVGGSRGLGAEVVRALAMQGCTVLATYWKSTEDAQRVTRSLAHAPGTVEFVQGDAADVEWCRDVLYPKMARHARLDLLVCSAAPALRPLGLDTDGIERFRTFTAQSLGLVAAPLATLLEPLSEHSGWCVLVSSSALESPPAEWPHYIAAKSAAEGLIRWAASKHTKAHFLIARPPRMLTDLVNTPGGQRDGLPPEVVAEAILARLSNPSGARIELLETFADER